MAKNITKNWKTKLIHSDAKVPEGFRALSAPVTRASTVLFPNAAASNSGWDPYADGYTYGTHGTPTTVELAARVCELENGTRTLLAPSGLAAISLINFALLKAGDHVLMPISVYGPNRKFASVMLRKFGVETTFCKPGTGAGIAALLRETTRLVWCERRGGNEGGGRCAGDCGRGASSGRARSAGQHLAGRSVLRCLCAWHRRDHASANEVRRWP